MITKLFCTLLPSSLFRIVIKLYIQYINIYIPMTTIVLITTLRKNFYLTSALITNQSRRLRIQTLLHNSFCSSTRRRLKNSSTANDENSKQKLVIVGGVLFLLATVSISAVYLPFIAAKVVIFASCYICSSAFVF